MTTALIVAAFFVLIAAVVAYAFATAPLRDADERLVVDEREAA